MIVTKYGIKLIRLTEEDIELVREKRNSQSIRSKMFYQKIISIEEQAIWFASINNENNFYFLIEVLNKKVGLIHGKINSYTDKIAEGGIFIWDEKILESHIPVCASVCMADLTFMLIKMDKTIAEVKSDNSIALNYNYRLGYSKISEDITSNKTVMELIPENYFKSARVLRRTLRNIAGETTDLSWNDIEFNAQDFESLYPHLPDYLQKGMKLRKSKL